MIFALTFFAFLAGGALGEWLGYRRGYAQRRYEEETRALIAGCYPANTHESSPAGDPMVGTPTTSWMDPRGPYSEPASSYLERD